MEAVMAENEIEFLTETLESVFHTNKDIKEYLATTSNEYRFLDPGRLLYIMAMKVPYKNRFDEDYIKHVYVTLQAWNMNSRGAKLHSYNDFSDSLLANKKIFDLLHQKKIDEFSKIDKNLLSDLFDNWKLSKTKAPLVTFTKTLHFFLPDLIVPIDRKFTLSFFKKDNQSTFRKDSDQFSIFCAIESAFSRFTRTHELKKYIDSDWNQNVPKILDNLIIGYTLSQKEA